MDMPNAPLGPTGPGQPPPSSVAEGATGPAGPISAVPVVPNAMKGLLDELATLDRTARDAFNSHDAGARLLAHLPVRFLPDDVACSGSRQRAWELAGLVLKTAGRFHEALAVFWRLYQHMLIAQQTTGWVHKGMALVWISDCFAQLGFRVHAKRYLMLTLCEDALREHGTVTPSTGGIYFRLVWGHGLRDHDFHRYAAEFWRLHSETAETQVFPEALLQRIDNAWMTELPSPEEAFFYLANEAYATRLLDMFGDGTGHALEFLAEYLLSCMPGCRTLRRQRSASTDYDIVCSLDGVDVDFRSELGRCLLRMQGLGKTSRFHDDGQVLSCP